jgi:predicted ArsR family transcriptional regulator
MKSFDPAKAHGRSAAEDWWGKLDDELLDCLRVGAMSAEEVGARLGVSEDAAVSLLSALARDGRVRISRVELP